jgi:hypothetical protein
MTEPEVIQRIWMPPLWEVGDGIIPVDAQSEDDDVSYILATPEALAASPEVQVLIADAVARGMKRAADICNARGAREEANFGLTRAAQNYYRARDDIRKDTAAIRDGHMPGE